MIHYLQRYALAFTVTLTNAVFDGAGAGQLFEAVQSDLGQVSLAFSNSRYYQKQRFLNAPADLIRKWCVGMCAPLDMEKIDGLNANATSANTFLSYYGAVEKGSLLR